jgi:hypothetical protein
VMILAMAAVPVAAMARGGGHGSHGGFHGGYERLDGHERCERFHGSFFSSDACLYGIYAPCHWQRY